MFDPMERAFLRDAAMSPVWRGILAKLGAYHRPPPKYEPGKGTSREQELDWIYWSGVDRCRTDLLKLLGNE